MKQQNKEYLYIRKGNKKMEDKNNNILNKKIDSYDYEKDDFKAPGEITVEITLNEYRHLVKEYATKRYDIERTEKDKYTREDENKKLKERVKDLENKIYKYTCKFGILPEEVEEEDE